MREKLVCYLLGELEEAERSQLEARLAVEPALREELEQIRQCLEFSEQASSCPTDLAARTVDTVERLSHHVDGVEPCGRSSSWTLVDVGVAVGVVMALSMMVLPALPVSREDSRRIMCQDNMRQIGRALTQYADNHGDYFPPVGPRENAGMFAVRLAEEGNISQSELSRLLWCRASGLREGSSRVVIMVPKTKELQDAKGQALAMLRRWMAGSYAYRLGYVRNDRYYPIRNYTNSRSPMLSDAPMQTVAGDWTSVNHGRKGGQNVLYQDGSVCFQMGRVCPTLDNNLFVNRQGKAAAGRGETDVVLVRSDLTPGVGPSIKPVVPAVLRNNAQGAAH